MSARNWLQPVTSSGRSTPLTRGRNAAAVSAGCRRAIGVRRASVRPPGRTLGPLPGVPDLAG
jgi:hypothetical protein